jgi:flagellar basal body-associated protein FliL
MRQFVEAVKKIGTFFKSNFHDHDDRVRRLSAFFLALVAGGLFVFYVFVSNLYHNLYPAGVSSSKKEHHDHPKEEHHTHDHHGGHKKEPNFLSLQAKLGQFELPLISDVKSQYGINNFAQITLIAVCAQKESCTWIKEHLQEVRNVIVNNLNPTSRDELVVREGKKQLRVALAAALNLLLEERLPKGFVLKAKEKLESDFVKDVYIEELLIV